MKGPLKSFNECSGCKLYPREQRPNVDWEYNQHNKMFNSLSLYISSSTIKPPNQPLSCNTHKPHNLKSARTRTRWPFVGLLIRPPMIWTRTSGSPGSLTSRVVAVKCHKKHFSSFLKLFRLNFINNYFERNFAQHALVSYCKQATFLGRNTGQLI